MNLSRTICHFGELLKNLAIPLATFNIFLISGTEADCTMQRFNTCVYNMLLDTAEKFLQQLLWLCQPLPQHHHMLGHIDLVSLISSHQ